MRKIFCFIFLFCICFSTILLFTKNTGTIDFFAKKPITSAEVIDTSYLTHYVQDFSRFFHSPIKNSSDIPLDYSLAYFLLYQTFERNNENSNYSQNREYFWMIPEKDILQTAADYLGLSDLVVSEINEWPFLVPQNGFCFYTNETSLPYSDTTVVSVNYDTSACEATVLAEIADTEFEDSSGNITTLVYRFSCNKNDKGNVVYRLKDICEALEYQNLSFLTQDQQVLYRRATQSSLICSLFSLSDNLCRPPLYFKEECNSDNSTRIVELSGKKYELFKNDYNDFLDFVEEIFTSECLDKMGVYDKFIDYNGKLAAEYNSSTPYHEGYWVKTVDFYPDTYIPCTSTSTEVNFLLISHYDSLHLTDANKMQIYLIKYPIRMILTESGWRIDEFHTTAFG